MQKGEETLLDYRQYIKDATRTESDYVVYCASFNDDCVERFYQFLQEFVKLAQWADIWKKFLMYRKGALPAKMDGPFSVHTPLRINELRAHYIQTNFARLFHGAIGLLTEAGEILEAIQADKIDMVNIREESGDAKWYLAIIDDQSTYSVGMSPEEIFRTNILKLRARYPEKFTEALAIGRDLVTERKVLEANVALVDELYTRRAGDKIVPAHYGGAENPYEAIKVISAWGLNFNLGSVLKYICRAGKKPNEPELDDLRKARFYLDAQIKHLEKQGQREEYQETTDAAEI